VGKAKQLHLRGKGFWCTTARQNGKQAKQHSNAEAKPNKFLLFTTFTYMHFTSSLESL